MSDEKINPEDEKIDVDKDEAEEVKSRREALGKILVGGGVVASASFLPEKWVKPIVDFIEVPAHALTSTFAPTASPTSAPTGAPTAAPTTFFASPTAAPTTFFASPTAAPTSSPEFS